MKNPFQVIAFVVGALIAVVVVIFVINRPKFKIVDVVGNNGATTVVATPLPTPPAKSTTSASSTAKSVANATEAAPTPEPSPTPFVRIHPGEPGFLETLDPTDPNQYVLSTRDFAILLDETTIPDLYALLYPANRQSFHEYLRYNPDAFREFTPQILALETDPDLRMSLLEMQEPNYVPRESESYDPSLIDTEFLEVLRSTPPTPFGPEEWNARQILAGLVSDEAALEFARKSSELFPEDDSVALVSATQILNYAGERAPISPTEKTAAESTLKRVVQTENFFKSIPSERRLKAYELLAKSTDPDSLRLLRDAQQREPVDSLVQDIARLLEGK